MRVPSTAATPKVTDEADREKFWVLAVKWRNRLEKIGKLLFQKMGEPVAKIAETQRVRVFPFPWVLDFLRVNLVPKSGDFPKWRKPFWETG